MNPKTVSGLELRRFATFEDYSDEEVAFLADNMKGMNFGDGDQICVQGDVGSGCYLLIDGTVQVYRTLPTLGPRQMGTLIPGAIFGHLSLIDGQPRMASCVAVGSGRVAELARDDFRRLCSGGSAFALKFHMEVSRALIRQLRLCNQRLSEIDGEDSEKQGSEFLGEWLEAVLGEGSGRP